MTFVGSALLGVRESLSVRPTAGETGPRKRPNPERRQVPPQRPRVARRFRSGDAFDNFGGFHEVQVVKFVTFLTVTSESQEGPFVFVGG